MTPCPVCETPNPPNLAECATCGKVLVKVAVPDAPSAALADLETGRLDSSAIAAPVAPMPELDLARAAPVNVLDERTPDLDLGRNAPVGNVLADATPDMERTAVAEKEWTPEASGPVQCRACGTPQADPTSIFCGHCGRRLPVRQVLAGELILDATPAGEETRVRCFSCGAKVEPADLCSDCGMPLRPQGA